MTLAENQAPLRERIRHLWEEMLDGLAYSEWIWDAYMCRLDEHPDSGINQSVALTSVECRQKIIQSLVELDRLMRALGMDPVNKEGADE